VKYGERSGGQLRALPWGQSRRQLRALPWGQPQRQLRALPWGQSRRQLRAFPWGQSQRQLRAFPWGQSRRYGHSRPPPCTLPLVPRQRSAAGIVPPPQAWWKPRLHGRGLRSARSYPWSALANCACLVQACSPPAARHQGMCRKLWSSRLRRAVRLPRRHGRGPRATRRRTCRIRWRHGTTSTFGGVALCSRQCHSPHHRHLGIAAVVRLRARRVAQHGVAVVRRQSFCLAPAAPTSRGAVTQSGCGAQAGMPPRVWCETCDWHSLHNLPLVDFGGSLACPGVLAASAPVLVSAWLYRVRMPAGLRRLVFLEHRSSGALEGIGSGAARCASRPAPGFTSLASGAAPCHRAICDRLRRCRRSYLLCVRCGAMPSCRRRSPTVRGPQHQQASRLSRAVLRPTIVPEVVTCSAAVSACERGQQYQQNLPLLRAMRRDAIVRDGVTCSATMSACERASSTCRLHISYVRCGALPSFRRGSPAVPPSTCATGASSTSRPGISYEGHRAMPYRRIWPPTVCQRRAPRVLVDFACAGMPLVGTGER